MGAKVPKVLRVEVIRKWLQGKTRDKIANEVDIGAGTVSGIIKEYKRDDPDADLIREVALKIKHEGMDIQSFAPLIRLREMLKQREWILGLRQGEQEGDDGGLDNESEKKMESLIISLEVFCFKRNLTIIEFFDSIYKVYLAAEKFDIPIEEFPIYVPELEAKIETLTEDNRITKKELEGFKARNQKLTQQLVKAEEEEEGTKYKINQKLGSEVEWMIDEGELEWLNEDLGTDKVINPSDLREMLMDIYYHPSKYGDIVRELIGRSIDHGPLSESFRRWLSRKK